MNPRSNPLPVIGNLSAEREPLRLLLAAREELRESLVAMLRGASRLAFELQHETDPTTVIAELARGQHDVYVLSGELHGTPLASVIPETFDDMGSRVVVLLHENEAQSMEDPAEAGVLQFGLADITGALLEHAIEHGLRENELRNELHMAEQRYALTVAAANDGMWHWDVQADRMRFSPRWRALLGYTDAELGNTSEEWLALVHPDDVESLRANLRAHIDGLTPIHEFEHRVRHRNGRWRWVLSRGLAHRDEWGRPTQMAGSLTDISRRKAFEHRLQHDSVTGLASRMTLMERLAVVIERHKRDPTFKFAVLFLNLDRFKMVNDSIGLESGDRILSQLGERLLGCVASNHLVCRYGGDEFAILLEAIDDFDLADQVSASIHDALQRPFVLDGHEVFTTASIGITLSSRNYDRPAEVIRDVGVAINTAKRHGKGGNVTFDTSMRLEAVSQLRMQIDLRQAVDREEFEVFYQPIVSLADNVLTGFEALVRWRHPQRGLVSPVEFIPVAEETGLIVPIGRYVLEQSCRQLADWRSKLSNGTDLTVSVNLSSRQLTAQSLLTDIDHALAHSQLPPEALKLELTESTLIDDPDVARDTLQQIRDRGVRIYIDDFGTGYSSLSYLHQLAVDGLKIDKSFVDMVGLPERRSAIVPSIVSLAHSLGMGVVAEGVETTQQMVALRQLQCAEGQGYLFSRPVAWPEAEAFIKRGRL